MVIMIDYERNLIVQSIKCLFLDQIDRVNECEMFFGKFQLVGNVEPVPFKIGSVNSVPKLPVGETGHADGLGEC